MYNLIDKSAGTRYLAETKTRWFNLTTRQYCPELFFLSENRGLISVDKAKRRKLKKSILEQGMVMYPILCDSKLNIYDGQHRWQIVNELWDAGENIAVGIVINPWLDTDDTNKIRHRLITLQEGCVWSPFDKLKSLSEQGNETAQTILKLAYEPVKYTSKGFYGIRNAFVAMGRNPDDFETLPYVCGQEEYEFSKRIFDETKLLLTLGVKTTDKVNNWTEAFIKAWRRIRANDKSLMKEDENGDRAVVNTEALNVMIDDIGLELLGTRWRAYADKAYSSGKMGRWATVLETAIVNTFDFKNRNIS